MLNIVGSTLVYKRRYEGINLTVFACFVVVLFKLNICVQRTKTYSYMLYSAGSATNRPHYPRKHTVPHPGRVQMGKGRGA